MTEMPLVIEEKPRGFRGRFGLLLKGRRILLAALLALVEIVAIIVWGPGVLLAVAGAIAVLTVAVLIATRIKPGFGRDLLWIVAGAQAMMVAPIVVVGASLFLGLVIAAALVVGVIFLVLRMRL